jgi:hypothetical protein
MNTQHTGTTVPNVGIAAAKPKPRGKRATLAAAVVSAGLTLFGLGLAAGTAQADPDWGECVSNQCPDGGGGGIGHPPRRPSGRVVPFGTWCTGKGTCADDSGVHRMKPHQPPGHCV